ncbi:MAG: sigma-54-dependent Fis family transcriptional regulator [FCB group bacterium]|nr:sigma-54-dependent Fis family transcriptional regulator [FCB group bacterium]
MKHRVLIIDDDENFITDLSILLESDYQITSSTTPADGLNKVANNNPDIVLLDLKLEAEINGLEVLAKIRKMDDSLPVIMITDYGSVDTAVEAMRLGASDYISKTPNMRELDALIKKVLQQRIIKLQALTLQEENRKDYHSIIGESQGIRDLNEIIHLMASNDNPVLITGESGTGKELVARQIHLQSDRRNKPFISLNCAAIPKDLIESELFGYEKGAFTGADKRKLGKFEVASEGIIFFDEISDLSPDAQVKLLRVLQEKEFERLGGNTLIRTSARVIAATNGDLAQMMQDGRFRSDLYYRLDVLRIHVPALRDRKEDIPLLVNHFMEKACLDVKVPLKTMSENSLRLFMNYDWPGNIRELRNIVIRAVILTRGNEIRIDDLNSSFRVFQSSVIKEDSLTVPDDFAEMTRLRKAAADKASRKVEKQFVQNLLNKHNGNVSAAVREIGMNRSNFHKMMKRCGIR